MVPFIAAVMVATGLFCVVLGIGVRARSKSESLRTLIEAELAEPSVAPDALADLMTRAGAVAERVLGRTSVWDRIELMLTQSGWSLRPGEFVAVVGASAVGVALLPTLLSGSPLLGLVVAVMWAIGFVSVIARKGRTRARKIEEQLPSVLQVLAGSLEAGSSVLAAFEIVVEEGGPPLATEFARVVDETKLGRPLLESLEALASRIGCSDLDWTVEAIRIQQQSGGKLADTLRVLADFMRARMEVRGEVRALSAEARLSAKVLTALPILIGAFFFLFRRGYFSPLYTTSVGRVLLVIGASGVVMGSLWMRRLVRVEV